MTSDPSPSPYSTEASADAPDLVVLDVRPVRDDALELARSTTRGAIRGIAVRLATRATELRKRGAISAAYVLTAMELEKQARDIALLVDAVDEKLVETWRAR